jgi:hypothetical protein
MSGCPTLALIAATTASNGFDEITLKRSIFMFVTAIFLPRVTSPRSLI